MSRNISNSPVCNTLLNNLCCAYLSRYDSFYFNDLAFIRKHRLSQKRMYIDVNEVVSIFAYIH